MNKFICQIFLVITFSFIGCNRKSDTKIIPDGFGWVELADSSKINVFIKYSETVEDYKVTAICLVDTSDYAQHNRNAVYGKGYLHFENEEKEFIIEVDSYTDINLIKNKKPLYDGCLIETPYIQNAFEITNGKFRLESDSPFFFFDIDFDNEKELIVTLWHSMGFKEHNAYEIYDIIETSNPYNRLISVKNYLIPQLNDFTEIDTLNKRISIPFDFYSCSGNPYFYGQELIYEAKPYAVWDMLANEINYVNNLVLKEHIKHDGKVNPITSETISVNNHITIISEP